MKTNNKIFTFIAFAVFFFSFAGCSHMRGVQEFTVPKISEQKDGPKVQITEVIDNRIFELKPSSPSTPSLQGGQIDDKKMTSRAIARKQNYFVLGGDIFISEERTVEQVIKETIKGALVEKGYTVVEKSGSDVATMTVAIQKFWFWLTAGFLKPKLDFQLELMLSSSILKEKPPVSLESSVQSYHFGVTPRVKANALSQGLAKLRANVVAALKDPN